MKVNDAGFLHEHNMEAYVKVKEILKEAQSCAVVQPTGTGKSHIMMKLLDDYKDDWKIVIAPSRDFLNNLESKEAWTSNKTITLTYSVIGIRSEDIENLLTEYLINPDMVKLILIDEMHRAGAPKWGAGLNKLINLCKNAKIVGLTATPKRYSEKRDMVEELFGGRLAQNMNLSEAINRKIIPKLSYVVGMHNIKYDLNRLLREYTFESGKAYMSRLVKQYEDKWDFDNYFVNTITKYLDTNIKTGKHIIFVSSISEADRLKDEVKEWFKHIYKESIIKVYNINSKSNTKSIDTEEFFEPNDEYEIKVAIAVNMLNESFHSDEIKSISMFRGTQSLQVYMQQIGRALVANGNAPFIFDFVDNYNSLNQLSNELKNTTFRSVDGRTVKSESIFDKFYDETDWFVKDIEQFKTLNSPNSVRPYEHIIDMMNKLDCEIIFELENKDKELFDWCIGMISRMHYRNYASSQIDVEQHLYKKFGILANIFNVLGYKWYITFNKWKNNSDIFDETTIKQLKSAFYKAVILKQLEVETLNYLSINGLSTKIHKNKKTLINLLSKNTCNNFKYLDKLSNIEEISSCDNQYTFYRTFELILENINNINRTTFLPKDFGDAVAYWLVEVYKEEYKEKVQELQTKYEKYNDVITFCRAVKKSNNYISDSRLMNNIDRLIFGVDTFDNIQEDARDILRHYGIKSFDSLSNFMLKTLSLVEGKKYIERKLLAFDNKQITLEKLKEFTVDNIKRIENILKPNQLTWSEIVTNAYNEIKEYSDIIINSNNENLDKLNNLVYNIINNKNKKTSNKISGAVNCKYNNVINYYNDARLFVNEIADDFKDEYLKNVEMAIESWSKIYGNDSITENQFAIGCYAISMCSFSRKIMTKKTISTKLINQIVLFLEYIIKNEKTSSDNEESNIKLVKILRDDNYYIFNLCMNKQTRKYFISLYDAYKINGRIMTDTCVNLFENMSSKDSSLINIICNSKIIQELTDLNLFCNKLVEVYEK